jgi:hypothetical protein
MALTVATRAYNGPFMTANAQAVRIQGDLEVTRDLYASNLHVTSDVFAANAITTGTLYADSVVLGADMTAANMNLSNLAAVNTFANTTTYGATLEAYADENAGLYVTNAVKRAYYGSAWLGSSASVKIDHQLDLDPNTYVVVATYNDTSDIQQIVTPQVSEKTRQYFWINLVPNNASASASVSFSIQELPVPQPAVVP